MGDDREIFIKAWLIYFENADIAVLEFIYDFVMHKDGDEDAVTKLFKTTYSYQFAHMLRATFKRGTVCYAKCANRYVWMDNNIPYMVEGIETAETKEFVPEEQMGDAQPVGIKPPKRTVFL